MISGTGSTLFEELGLYYIGPVDGHNLDDLVAVLSGAARGLGGQLRERGGCAPARLTRACPAWSCVRCAEVQSADTVGPVLVHVVTDKGRGYTPAETSQDKMHGVVKFDPKTGQQFTVSGARPRQRVGRAGSVVLAARRP